MFLVELFAEKEDDTSWIYISKILSNKLS